MLNLHPIAADSAGKLKLLGIKKGGYYDLLFQFFISSSKLSDLVENNRRKRLEILAPRLLF